MQPRVTAILVARNGAEFLEHTLAALRSQTRPLDAVVLVDSGSSDATSAMLAAANPTQLVNDGGKRGFTGAVAHGVQLAPPAESEDDWIWVLSQDSAPHPRALENLLGAVEIAPSVAIAGPKLMRWDRPDMISEYGETVTRFGTSIALVENELDQAQHDASSDFLGVAAAGMLVRRSVWSQLGGFDPALPSIDAGLDLSIRARLAGYRVVGVPSARILTAGGPELFGRAAISSGARSALNRSAQIHRRLVYSPAWLLPLHWLSLLPLAIIRSIFHLIRKHPGAIGGEFRAAVVAAFSRGVASARSRLRRTRKVGWAGIASLRLSSAAARELRVQQQETAASAVNLTQRTRVGFFSGGGGWAVLIAAVVGVIAFSPLLGGTSLVGGALAPLSSRVSELWANVGYGFHAAGGGFVGAADPFSFVLAVLGSTTFWAPSVSIVVLYLIALPAAALGAWWCGVRFSERSWPPAVAALLWGFAPPFLSSLEGGHIGAIIAHILLPWFAILVFVASRSWSAAAGSALVFAVIVASAPILAPALLIALLAWMALRPSRIPRLIGVLIPTAALFAPLVVDQVRRGNWIASFAEPGVPVATSAVSGWHLALGSSDAGLNGWETAGAAFGLPDVAGPVLAAVLLAPFAVLALLSLFMRGSTKAIPAMVVALLGFATAVASTLVQVSFVGSDAVGIWPGAGLSLFWFGLTGAVVLTLDGFTRAVVWPSLIVVVASTLAVGPLLAAPLSGSSPVVASTGTATLPAFVTAEASGDPTIGTLQIDAQPDGGLAVTLHRGTGTTLDEQSTLAATSTSTSDTQRALAELAGNLASDSGLDLAAKLNDAHIGFILVTDATTATSSRSANVSASGSDVVAANGTSPNVGSTTSPVAEAGTEAEGDAGTSDSDSTTTTDGTTDGTATDGTATDGTSTGGTATDGTATDGTGDPLAGTSSDVVMDETDAVRQRVVEALDGNAILAPIGDTAVGKLWHFQGVTDATPATGKSAFETPIGIGILAIQGFIFFVTLLLAVPTSRGRGRATVADASETAPGFDEDDNA
ncbi:MAG: glycosyltransferase family 2 protein [Glaciihabitans sp.]|nr:glycosyltransferase family 2 protein [Glaciihabitans sp.]